MNNIKKHTFIAVGIVLTAIVVDQILKVWVKTNMHMHEMIEITSWFKIFFTENQGMAFGMELMDKICLTLFRIVAVGFLIYILYKNVKKERTRASARSSPPTLAEKMEAIRRRAQEEEAKNEQQ